MPVKGLAKRGGVPASPLAMPGQVESGKKGPIQQKGFFPSSITDLYWEQSVAKKRNCCISAAVPFDFLEL